MNLRSTHDVVIVGARTAGAATALLLARAGLDVLVVDRGRYGLDTLSTHALMRAGVLQLHRWGLLDNVIAAGTPPVRRTTFSFTADRVRITIKPSYGVDALYAPRRTVLDPILVDAARQAGADVEYGTIVTSVTRDRDGRVTGVRGRARDGQPAHHSARWIIGADGIHSVIAEAVGARVERQGTGALAYTYGYWSDLDADGYEWIFRPERCAGAIPTNGGQTCVFAAGRPARIGHGGRNVLLDTVRAASPELGDRLAAARPAGHVRTFHGLPGHLRRPWGPGWALVGDAGSWKDPIATHGLTDALRDAELLARAVIAAHQGADEDTALDRVPRDPQPPVHPPVRRRRRDRRPGLDRRPDPRPAPPAQLVHERRSRHPRPPRPHHHPHRSPDMTPRPSLATPPADPSAALSARVGTLLGVWAHPDDEAYLSAGLMALARRHGRRVVVITATAGELGTSDPEAWPPRRLARRRRARDGGQPARRGRHRAPLARLPRRRLPRPSPAAAAVEAIGRIVDEVRPDTIVTFGPDGMTGHPDHIAVSGWTTGAWQQHAPSARLWYATQLVVVPRALG